MGLHLICFSAIIVALVGSLDKSSAIPVDEDLALTDREIFALDEFKLMVQDSLPEEYMKTDIYLIKWIRAKNLNLKAAKKMLLDNLKWRREKNMEWIAYEDFSDLETQFPATLDAFDLTGRPVLTVDVADWDVRRAILTGQREKVTRHAYRLLEMATIKVRKAQEEGQNVTQFTVLCNLKGFNLVQHGCVNCLPIYLNFVIAFENYYPGMIHKFIGINTPPTFDVILRLLRPVMSPMTKAALVVYPNDKRTWERVILDMIDPDQIDEQFGGNRIE